MRNNTTFRTERSRGFALVATVSMMVLLSMVALAMLSLASLEQRSSGGAVSAGDRAARANARLALMMAIGELQRAMGPDQRVSAEGGLTGTAGYGKSHWVGAWSSEDADGDLEPDGEFKGWLVSSNLSGADGVPYEEISSDASSNDENWVRLVGSGTVDTNTQNDHEVYTQRISVNAPGTEGAGHLAWWVGDEGVKARVDLRNTQSDLELASQGTQRSALEVIPGFESVDNADPLIQKMVSRATMGMLGGASAQALKDHFHSMTVHSLALQTDTRHGGLKKDLSLLFEMTDEDFEAISPETYAAYVNAETPVSADSEVPKGLLFHDQGIHGPTIDLLRNHYRQYKTNAGTATSPMVVANASYPNKTEFGQEMWRRTTCIHAWHWALYTDPNTSTRIKPVWFGGGDFPVTRLLKGNVTPYLNRVIIYFSVQAVPIPDNTPLNTQDDKYNLQLKIQPILYVHNPYNVRMRIDGMRYLKEIGGAALWIVKDGVVIDGPPDGYGWPTSTVDFTALLNSNDEAEPLTSGLQAQFVVDHAVDFAPGEVKIFVPSSHQSWGAEMKMEELGNAFDPDEMALTIDLTYVTDNGGGPTAAISQIPSGTQLQMSLCWGLYAMEDFEIYEDARGGYNTVWSGLSQWRPSYSTGALTTRYPYGRQDAQEAPAYAVEDLKTTTPVVVDDRFVKPAKFKRHGSGFEVGPPSFLIGNPLSSSDSNCMGTVYDSGRTPGAAMYSNIFHSHMDYGQIGYPYFQDALIGNYGTWGSNNGSAGEGYTTVLEVPTAPLHSLGALQHANIAVEGYQPGLAIGNSLPNLTMSDHSKLVEPIFGQQNYDLSYMANRALWDSYYFSSITPRPSDSSYTSIESDTQPDITKVIEEFAKGDELLGNTRMRLIGSGTALSSLQNELNDFQYSAAHLAVAGGFNVNSTSVKAWKAYLSGYRDASLRTASGVEENDGVSVFPRISFPVAKGVVEPVAENENMWVAFAQLSDVQIEDLAKAIVEQIKTRAKQRQGSASVTPALTMGQFVNRMLSGDQEMMQKGLLQAAIDKSGINGTMESYGTYDSGEYGSLPEQYAFVGDGKEIDILAASSAPTSSLQSDILQALGASMSPRSDTFIVRGYGDAVDSNGRVLARAWCEAVVQRTPTPVNPDAADAWKPADESFGRRLQIVSFRWLAKDEI